MCHLGKREHTNRIETVKKYFQKCVVNVSDTEEGHPSKASQYLVFSVDIKTWKPSMIMRWTLK